MTEASCVIFGGQLNDYLGSTRWFITEASELITAKSLMAHFSMLSESINLTLMLAQPTPQFDRKAYGMFMAEAVQSWISQTCKSRHIGNRGRIAMRNLPKLMVFYCHSEVVDRGGCSDRRERLR